MIWLMGILFTLMFFIIIAVVFIFILLWKIVKSEAPRGNLIFWNDAAKARKAAAEEEKEKRDAERRREKEKLPPPPPPVKLDEMQEKEIIREREVYEKREREHRIKKDRIWKIIRRKQEISIQEAAEKAKEAMKKPDADNSRGTEKEGQEKANTKPEKDTKKDGKENKEVYEGFDPKKYEELIESRKVEHEKYLKDKAELEKQQREREIDKEKNKLLDEFEKKRKKELDQLAEKKKERTSDEKARNFLHDAFAGNTFIDDAIWMTATLLSKPCRAAYEAYQHSKVDAKMDAVNKDYMKQTEDIQRKAEANKKSLAELKNRYICLEKEEARFNRMIKNPEADAEHKKYFKEQLGKVKLNMDFVKGQIEERGLSNVEELDKHNKEVADSLEKCKLLRDEVKTESLEISKDMDVRREQFKEAYIAAKNGIEIGKEFLQNEKSNMQIAEDYTERHKEIQSEIKELEKLHDDPKTTFEQKNEIEHQINYLREYDKKIVYELEIRTEFWREGRNTDDYIEAVEQRYMSYEHRQDVATYEQIFNEKAEEANKELEKLLENMPFKDIGKFREQCNEVSQDQINSYREQVEKYKNQISQMEQTQGQDYDKYNAEFEQCQKKLSDLHLKEAAPNLSKEEKAEIHKFIDLVEKQRNRVYEQLYDVTGNKQPNFQYKNFDRSQRNTIEAQMQKIQGKINRMEQKIKENDRTQEKKLSREQENAWER